MSNLNRKNIYKKPSLTKAESFLISIYDISQTCEIVLPETSKFKNFSQISSFLLAINA